MASVSAASVLNWQSMLDDEERVCANRYHFERDRDAFIAAHALIRIMLSDVYDVPPSSWRFVQGPHGKPAIAADCSIRSLRFNLSHTRDLVACAISDGCDVGVDVEATERPADLTLADRYFAPEEVIIIRSVPPHRQRQLFFRFWTLKEAFIKATGEGLSRPLSSFSFTLDPIRIAFHPDRDEPKRDDKPMHWQFIQRCVWPDHILALAVLRPDAPDLQIDIRPMRTEDMPLRRPQSAT
jgi:4'-phosphopantetheinyl transferase